MSHENSINFKIRRSELKKYIWLIITMSLVLAFCAGCGNNNTQETSQENFKEKLCDQTYSTNIMGYDVSGKLEEDGEGTVNLNGKDYNFKYSLTDPKDDSAKITIQDTGIPEIDGKSADIKLEGNDLVVTYGGMSYTVKGQTEKE